MFEKNKELWEDFYRDEKFIMWYPDESVVKFFGRESKEKDLRLLKGLDLGCGIGRHVRLMSDFGMNVTGLDISQTAVDKAIGYSFLRKGKGIFSDYGYWRFNTFDGKKIPYPKESFDYIVCFGVLDHMLFKDAKGLMKEFKRVLKKKGKLFIAVHSTRDSNYKKGEFIEKNTYKINWGEVEIGLPQHYFDYDEIVELMSEIFPLNVYLHEDRKVPLPGFEYNGSIDSMWIVILQNEPFFDKLKITLHNKEGLIFQKEEKEKKWNVSWKKKVEETKN